MRERPNGEAHPGWRWGPFAVRLPFVHLRVEVPELVQGLFVTSATGLAVAPVYAEMFGMAFETAIALIVLQSLLICSAFLIFGDPFCPGWLTPALPLVLREAARYDDVASRIDFVNAVVLLTAALFLLFGWTRLGPWFLRAVPPAVRAAIILGAGLSAVYGEFLPRSGGRPPRLEAFTFSILLAVGVSLILLFSRPFAAWRRRFRSAAMLASLGIAPGFFLAMLAGPLFGEIDYSGFWAYAGPVILWPDFGTLISSFSVVGRGLPDAALFAHAFPLAAAAYIIGFGDIVTATAIVQDAAARRPDEKIPFDARRTHLAVGLRNGLVALLGGPFFPLQGPLWAGATIVVAERYRQGRAAMDSIFSGISSYYHFGIPVFYFIGPLLELFRPALDVAFSLTLLLTGFACAYVAMGMVHDRLERGVAFLAALVLVHHSAAAGLAAGLLLAALLLGPSAWREPGKV